MTTIKVNVFNLTPLNRVFACCKVGVYHTSVVIGEKFEFYYGFAAWGYPGIDSPEKLNEIPSSMSGTLHSSHIIGESELTLEDCHAIAIEMKRSDEWISDRYNLLLHNCNDFSKELCKVLVGEQAMKNTFPWWVSRGERIGKLVYSISLSHFFCFLKHIPSISNPTLQTEESVTINSDGTEDADIENVSSYSDK